MIDAQEPLFVVDENNKPQKPLPREQVHKKNLWHRTCAVWIYNSNRQILCQKRSAKKDIKPGYWEAFFGGHLAPNEDYLDSCVKEVGEELCLPLDQSSIEMYKVFKAEGDNHKEFQQVAFYGLEKEAADLDFEKDEIDQLEWLPIDEVEKILAKDKSNSWVHKPWDTEVLEVLKTRVDSWAK